MRALIALIVKKGKGNKQLHVFTFRQIQENVIHQSTSMAVSYTHLDVYKRQGILNAGQDASALCPIATEAALTMLDILSQTPPFSLSLIHIFLISG